MIKNTLIVMDIPFTVTGHLFEDVYLTLSENPQVLKHTKEVVALVDLLSKRFGVKPSDAKCAALLHDISAIVKNEQRIEFCQKSHIHLLEVEMMLPVLTHQKISVALAMEVYGISNFDVLSAIGCHTTLKEKPSSLDLLLFVTDKMKWDQDGQPPYYEAMMVGLEKSLEDSAFAYLHYAVHHQYLTVIHPWLLDAYNDLKNRVVVDL